MIDAVMRLMVHTHYKEISRVYELCRRSKELICDVCTAGSPKEFLVLQERCTTYTLLEGPLVSTNLTGIYVRRFMQQSCASVLAMRALCAYE